MSHDQRRTGNGRKHGDLTPAAIAIDSADNLYVIDSANNKIRKID